MRQTSLERYIAKAQTSQYFSEGEIMRGMRMALHRRGLGYSHAKVTPEVEAQKEKLLTILDELPHKITPELTAKGLRWFASMKKKDGSWRENNLTREFSTWHREIIDHLARFTFEGYYNAGNCYRDWYVPIYRVWSTNGDSFAYCYGAWQSNMSGLELFE